MGKFYEGLYGELSLYVRQAAWLHAVPETPGKKIDGVKPVSRLQAIRADRKDEHYVPDMPVCGAEYLVGYLWEVGPTMVGGMGEAPLSHGEIAAWQMNSGVELQPWEARFLRNLSREYLGQSQRSEKPDCPAPYGTTERRAIVAKRIDEIFG